MRVSILMACLGLAAFSGCSTVQSRIKEKPQVFQSLPETQKSLIQQGEIVEGMRDDAVWLAWGSPSSISEGSDHGAKVEEWMYYGNRTEVQPYYRPVLVSYGRRRSYWDYQFDQIVVSRQYLAKSVLFENGKVSAWRRNPNAY